jgi:hypothetical protein
MENLKVSVAEGEGEKWKPMGLILQAFVWIQFAVALMAVLQSIRTNERPFIIWALPIIIPLPFAIGSIAKRRIRRAVREGLMSKAAANLCDEQIINILFASYLCLAILFPAR